MATKQVLSVRDLANEAGLDADEALVRLWDAGLEHLQDASSPIFSRHAKIARRVVGAATRRDLMSPAYWQGLLRVDDVEFGALLVALRIAIRPGARTLPKGAVGKLRTEARRRGFALQIEPTPVEMQAPKTVPSPFEWRAVGHEKEIRHLTYDEVLSIHYELVSDFEAHADPINPAGPRNESILASAVFRPHTSIGDALKYTTVEMVAGALFHAIVQDHPFHNGNKRTALVSMLVSLDENGIQITCDENEMFRFVLHVAQHRVVDSRLSQLADREVLAIAEWIVRRSRLTQKGDRPIPWRRLRQILTAYDCVLEFPPGVGNRINILRRIDTKLWGIFPQRKILKVQVFYGDEGRDAERDTVAEIRQVLQIDEPHGIDSRAFYENAPVSSSEFILRYRKTLGRLAKL